MKPTAEERAAHPERAYGSGASECQECGGILNQWSEQDGQHCEIYCIACGWRRELPAEKE